MFDPEADVGLLEFERARTREAWRAEKGSPAAARALVADHEGHPALRKASLQTLQSAPPVPVAGELEVADESGAVEGAAGAAPVVSVPGRSAAPRDPEAPLRVLRLSAVAVVALVLLLLWIRQRSRY